MYPVIYFTKSSYSFLGFTNWQLLSLSLALSCSLVANLLSRLVFLSTKGIATIKLAEAAFRLKREIMFLFLLVIVSIVLVLILVFVWSVVGVVVAVALQLG